VFGSSNQNEQILEGSALYFECNVNANPSVNRVLWLFNGSPLTIENQTSNELWAQNGTKRTENMPGIKLSTNTLQIQSASRLHSGRYRCIASNTQGEAASDEIEMHVRYLPTCAQSPHVQHVSSTQLNKPEVITCDLNADPLDLQVHWFWKPISLQTANETFEYNALIQDLDLNASKWPFAANQSAALGWKLLHSEHVNSVPINRTNSGKSNSKVISRFPFVAPQNAPFSVLQCWANNSVGHQLAPCSIHVLSARSPDPPFNCSVKNTTRNALAFVCSPGYSGGLQQRFHLEVYELIKRLVLTPNSSTVNLPSDSLNLSNADDSKHTKKLLFNLTVIEEPSFILNELPEGNRFVFNSL
jgi:hypothetical protein